MSIAHAICIGKAILIQLAHLLFVSLEYQE
ncbi:MAG: hypothetical protein ACJAY4_001068 [Cryomorphaceae bacterium]|jgi:hypothetical protein